MSLLAKILALTILAVIIPACGKKGDQGGMTPSAGFVVPGTGGWRLLAKGGNSSGGAGASGGNIFVVATAGSDLNLLSGALSVNTSFAVPPSTPYLGTNPRRFLTPGPAILTTMVGVPWVLGDDGATIATGLLVAPGVTLTITTNSPNVGLRNAVTLAFAHGIWIQGTLTVAKGDASTPGDAASNNSASLTLSCENLLTDPGATIVTDGATGSAAAPSGGNGGGIRFDSGSNVINQATISARGGAGFTSSGNGGRGGLVMIDSGTFLYSTGDITTSGGTGTAATALGGQGGSIILSGSTLILPVPDNSESAGCYVSGALTARGGDGGGGGGAGPSDPNPLLPAFKAGVALMCGGTSSVLGGQGIFNVTIDASGGNATVSGNGGAGAVPGSIASGSGILLSSSGGTLQVAGSANLRGGAGKGSGNGGAGGSAVIQQQYGAGASGTGSPPDVTGGMAVAFDVDSSGGPGTVGGVAGDIHVDQPLTWVPAGQNPCVLAGYASIDSSGGDGTSLGGNAGSISIANTVENDLYNNYVNGGIQNAVPLIALGGAASAGFGGNGSTVSIKTDLWPNGSTNEHSVVNSAPITIGGGTGTTGGGGAGLLTLYDHFSVTNSGAIVVNGGNGTAGSGASGGSASLQSDIQVSNSGAISCNGGNGAALNGGSGGPIKIQTQGKVGYGIPGSATNSGALTSNGGSGGYAGGPGGTIEIFDHFSATNSGTITCTGGTGGSAALIPTSGGAGGIAGVLSDISAVNTASWNASGGMCTNGTGGKGGSCAIVAEQATHLGNVTAVGGNGSAGSTGGIGGAIQVFSSSGVSLLHGTLNVCDGTPSGWGIVPGNVNVDGVDEPLTLGQITF